MLKVKLGLLALFIVSLVYANDSNSEIQMGMDSLRKRLETLNADDYNTEAKIRLEMAWNLRDVRPDSALYFANLALRIAENHHLIHDKIQATNYIGIAYRNLSNYSKAFEKYLEALNLAELSGDREQKGYSLINLGNLYLFQTNFQGAIRYFIQALDQAQLLADRRMVAYCYLNLGRSYMGIEEYGQAELYFQQAIAIRKDQGDDYGQIAAEIDLANVYMRKGDMIKSRKYYEDLLFRVSPEDNPRALCQVYSNLAKIYLYIGNRDKAESNAFKALAIAKEVSSRFDEKNVLENLSDIYADQEDFRSAYQYHTKYADLNQQLFSEENIRKIEQLKNQYTIEQQEAENQFLRKKGELNALVISRQKVIIVLGVIGILLLLMVFLISYRALRTRTKLHQEISKQRDQILSDKEIIESQASKLEELNEAKSRFFANVSHDLRTPLSLIYGNIEMLSEDEETILSQASKRNLDIGLKNCKRLLYLTDEINDLTKLEEGKILLKKEVVRIGSYLRMLSEMFTGTADYKGVKLVFENNLSAQDCISLDPRQFEKIFYNLVSNAIRHTNKGGEISIVTRKHLSRAIIEVRDTGEGIPEESLQFIFDRFYQAKNSPHRSREGMGIGLALVKELVDLHDGEIEVESVVGEGTNFILSFYLADQQGRSIEEEKLFRQTKDRRHLYSELDKEVDAGVSIPKIEPNRQTILLVDDHPEIRYHIRQILEDDYHVVEAAHGLEALDMIKMNEISLIISDLMMPWMDGFEFLEALNANEEYRKIPVLVVSARISEEDQEKVLNQGVNDYIKKPFNKKELSQRINNLLQHKENWEGPKDSFAKLFDKNGSENLEKEILKKVESLIMDRIDDVSLSVYDLADAMAASERQVYRLIKRMTGMTPYEYIMEIRMKYADFLIRKSKVKNATEAAKSIGLKNVTTFSKHYEKKFGKRPSEILNG